MFNALSVLLLLHWIAMILLVHISIMALSDSQTAADDMRFIFLYLGCQIILPPPPPIDIQTSCDLVVWHNAPNISYEDITGYEIQLINSAANDEEVIISGYSNASTTFYSLNWINETFRSESTLVEVRLSLS